MLSRTTAYFIPVNLLVWSIFRPISDRRDLPMAEAVRNETRCDLVYAPRAWRRPFLVLMPFRTAYTLRTWQKRRQSRLPLGTCICRQWNTGEGANAKYMGWYWREMAHFLRRERKPQFSKLLLATQSGPEGECAL
jgi:hypothetical protein